MVLYWNQWVLEVVEPCCSPVFLFNFFRDNCAWSLLLSRELYFKFLVQFFNIEAHRKWIKTDSGLRPAQLLLLSKLWLQLMLFHSDEMCKHVNIPHYEISLWMSLNCLLQEVLSFRVSITKLYHGSLRHLERLEKVFPSWSLPFVNQTHVRFHPEIGHERSSFFG